MTTHRIIPAAELHPGPTLVVLALGERTIRSRVEIALVEPHGVVRVAFASGDIVTLSVRAVVGVIDPPRRPAPGPRRRRVV